MNFFYFSSDSVAASKDEYLSIIQVTEDIMPIMEQDDMFFDARIYRASKEVSMLHLEIDIPY